MLSSHEIADPLWQRTAPASVVLEGRRSKHMVTFEQKPDSELERYYVELYERLFRANRLYDAHHQSEAPNIAALVAAVVYDHGTSSISLLTHLRLKSGASFVDTADAIYVPGAQPGTLMSNEYLLIKARIGFDGMAYIPKLGTGAQPRLIPFSDWWNGSVLSRYAPNASAEREYIQRGELINFIRNTETGAHVSGVYRRGAADEKLVRLMLGEYVDGYMVLNGGKPETAESHAPAYATVRQIGWEVEETLRLLRPDLVARADLSPTGTPRKRPVPPDQVV